MNNLLELTGIKVLDNIILDYKNQLDINDNFNKCMNELKNLNRNVKYTLMDKSKRRDRRRQYILLYILNCDTNDSCFIRENSIYSRKKRYTCNKFSKLF
jgi:hypothetical protein